MEAVVGLRYEQCYFRLRSGDGNVGSHAYGIAEITKSGCFYFGGPVAFEGPLNSLEKHAFFLVAMLISVDNVALAFIDPARDFRY